MEISNTQWCGMGVFAILVWYAWRFLNWVWLKPKKMEKFLREQGLKGTSYKFLFGDLKELKNMLSEANSKPIKLTDDIVHRVLPFHYKSITTYGKTCFTWLGPIPLVHIAEAAMVKEVLANNNKFQKARGNPFLKLLQTGLSDAEGDRWHKHRKIINPAFHVEKIQHMVPAFGASCADMINKWEELLTKDRTGEVNVWPYLQTLSSEIIARTAFGSSFEEGRQIFEMLQELPQIVVEALQTIYIPGSRFLPTKRNKRVKEINQTLKASIKQIINKRMIAVRAGESINDDLLGVLLDSNYKEIKHHENKSFGLSIDEIIEECKLFYFAGQETTSTLLVWTMILLSQYTNWQERARDEVSQVFGEKKPDVEGLSRLKTMSMIFNEVLRLYSPVITLTRTVHENTKLGNLMLPAGTLVTLHTYLLHLDSDIWGDDVNEFNPERFSEGVSKATKGQPASYLPFGGGPRICIGLNFALLEAKMTLAMILQRFSFDLSPSYSHGPISIITLHPQFGAHLNLCKL